MPFLGENDIGLFRNALKEDIENGTICLVKKELMNGFFLATKEETGFFEFDGTFLDSGDKITVVGALVNIETN